MATIRKINVSQVDGGNADNNDINTIRPFGETAFYLDNNNKLTLMMFDGVRTHQKSKVLSPGVLYGSNADAGDGSTADTIKLIPDAALGSDQYIVVDPTGGEPGHIHLRAGGTQDASGADLYLGGELTCVRVSDTSDSVTIRTTNIGDPNITMNWTFDNQGNLYFPGIGNNRIGESEPGLVVSSDAGVALVSNSMGDSKTLIFDVNGKLKLNNTEINAIGSQSQIGTIITVPLNAAGDTVDYTGGASLIEVPKNADTDQVQAGWIITFNGGAQRTVSGKIDGGSYYAITFNEANPGGTLYPLTIQTADYSAAVIGTIGLTPNPSAEGAATWTFRETGTIILPAGGVITEGIVTDNPTVAITPATPDVASQTLIIKGGVPIEQDYHLHLTTGDLTETSVILGTDEHNVRTTHDQGVGGVEITARSYFNETSTVWRFFPQLTGEGTVPAKIIFPDNTEQRTAWAGGRVVNAPSFSIGSAGDIAGDIAFTNSYIYYCTADYTDGLSNIWKRIAWSGDTW